MAGTPARGREGYYAAGRNWCKLARAHFRQGGDFHRQGETMFRNKILDRIKRGEKALGISMNEASEELVEIAGRMGLDFVNFDGQHAPLTPERVGTLCRIADGFDITPTMRIPDGQESTILSYLDRGIRQITVPNLLTKEEAQNLVKYTYFQPLGLRSSTSHKMVSYQDSQDRADLFADVNANVVLVPQIENINTVENLEEILTVDGIDYFGGGPEDMAQSMGIAGGHADPRIAEAYEQATAKLEAAGKGWWADHIETIDILGLVKGEMESLLEAHGRKSKLAW